MAVNDSVSNIVEELVDDIHNEPNSDTLSTISIEEISNHDGDDHQLDQDNNEDDRVVQNVGQIVNTQTSAYYLAKRNEQISRAIHFAGKYLFVFFPLFVNMIMISLQSSFIANELILLKINQINTEIDFVWKIQGVVVYKHPKRTYTNANGAGEVSTWDLVDDTGSINLVAFNLNSNLMSNKLTEGKSYEFEQLSIRTVDEVYKTLPHEFQLVVTNSTKVHEIVLNLPFNHEQTFNFTNLNDIEALPLNSIIDVDVLVLRDYGTTVGTTNNNSWSRRELHVAQDGVHIRLTLWNDKAKIVRTSMVNKHLKLKNVKVSWFNGSRVLATLGNTRLSVL